MSVGLGLGWVLTTIYVDHQDIQEVAQYLELKFSISLQWMDARVVYYNTKPDQNMNSLTLEEQQALWTPTIVFWNTKEQLRTLNDDKFFAYTEGSLWFHRIKGFIVSIRWYPIDQQ